MSSTLFHFFKINDFFFFLFTTVRGEWTPLVALAEQCGYTLIRRDADIVIAAPFITCGITVKVNFRKDTIHETFELHFQFVKMHKTDFFF